MANVSDNEGVKSKVLGSVDAGSGRPSLILRLAAYAIISRDLLKPPSQNRRANRIDAVTRFHGPSLRPALSINHVISPP